MSIFEIGMLVCFGFAWPLNIYKGWKSRTAVGQNPWFLIVVMIGYACGITHKILYNHDIVLYLYIINMAMIGINLMVYYRNLKIDRLAACQSNK